MIPGRGVDRSQDSIPSVLVVDDDRRVLELLEIAYSAHGFKVWTAADGEEAIQKALAEHPDLLVMDVRLPRKSGLDVCEIIRRDPDHYHVPIILVSAASETESRLQGLHAGADDYLPKPFSPKELIARSRRLLARSAEGREARRQSRDLERELARVQDEVKRTHLETRREHRLRELAFGLGRDLQRTLDLDEVARRLLIEAQARLGVGTAALLLPDVGDVFTVQSVRGDGLDRYAALAIARDGPLATLVRSLGRPVLERELERLPELRAELPPLMAAGCAMLAPLTTPEGLQGLLLVDERLDGMESPRADLEVLAGLCDLSAAALHTAQLFRVQLDRQLEWLADASLDPTTPARLEAAAVVDRAARATLLSSRLRGLLAHAIAFGPRGAEEHGIRTLAALAGTDPTGRAADLARLCTLATRLDAGELGDIPDFRRAASLLAAAHELAEQRAGGAGVEEAMIRVLDRAGTTLDPASAQALRAAAREAAWLEGSAA